MNSNTAYQLTVPKELINYWRNLPEYCTPYKKVYLVTFTENKLNEMLNLAANWGYSLRSPENEIYSMNPYPLSEGESIGDDEDV